MKNVVFVHQNMPAQFRYLAPAMAAAGHNVYFVTAAERVVPNVTRVQYQLDKKEVDTPVGFTIYGRKAATALVHLKKERGVTPDIVIGHVSWGELIYVKDVFPDTKLISYFEWFHSIKTFHGLADHAEDPNAPFVYRLRNMPNYVSGDISDAGITPTWWQYSTYPRSLQDKMTVIHDGVDTVGIRRPSSATVTLPSGASLSSDDEVVTYVARGLEPVRGFPSMMRAAAQIVERRPNAHVVIVGKDETSYGNPLPEGQTYRANLLGEVGLAGHPRIHFTGWVDYEVLKSLFYISCAHVYLTYPFILSWSFMEAMAAECLVIGSRTPPVEEVIVDGHNGLLVDFYDHEGLADKICAVLDKPRDYDPIRREARRTILERYDLHGICLPRQKALINSLL